MEKHPISQRLACRVPGERRSPTKVPNGRADLTALAADIVMQATHYGRNDYCRIAAMLTRVGWVMNVRRVERIFRLKS